MTRTYVVADLFCGAGGSSTGAKWAIEELGGEMDLVAVNHWNLAIKTHQANHPTARHLIEDVSSVDPESVVEGGYLDLLMASPECKFYSRARGGKPVHDQGRMSPNAILNWLTKLEVRCLMVENVTEFVKWGPLDDDDKVIKAREGEFFQDWYRSIQNLGYTIEYRKLNAADYGEATSRERFFLLARKDGVLIEWPEPTHAKSDAPLLGNRLPWRGAREVIDWDDCGRSLLDHPKYRKKPLSEKTRRRIARGLERFGGPLAPLYIRLLDLEDRTEVTFPEQAASRGFILNRHGENGSDRTHSVEEPMPTATTRGAGYLVQTLPEPFVHANRNHNAPKSMDDPIPTATTATGGGSFLVDPKLEAFTLGQQSKAAPRSVDDPMATIATSGNISLTYPLIIEYYGDVRVRDVGAPVPTITQRIKHALVYPHLVQYYGQGTAASVDDPMKTITARARKQALALPLLVEYYGNSNCVDVDEPLPTVTTKARHGLMSPAVIEVNHSGSDANRIHSVDEPLNTLTTKRGTALFDAVLNRHPSVFPDAVSSDSLFREIEGAGIDPRRLVIIGGHPYLLDIRFRMLNNSELARAMGFDDEESKYEFFGTVEDVTKQIGNAVPVRLAKALVHAILGQER